MKRKYVKEGNQRSLHHSYYDHYSCSGRNGEDYDGDWDGDS